MYRFIAKLIKPFRFIVTVLVITGWIFSGWPQIFNFPLKVHKAYAATPTIETFNTSEETSNTTTHTVNLPSGVASGDLVLVFFSLDTRDGGGSVTVSWPSPWVEIYDVERSGDVLGSAGYLFATGAETTVVVTSTHSDMSSHVSYRISGQHATSPPEGSAIDGSSINPDPPSVSASWGSDTNLWFVHGAFDRPTSSDPATDDPDNFVNAHEVLPTANSSAWMRTLELASSTNPIDPTTFTLTNSDQWVAGTVVVRPAAAAADPTFTQNTYRWYVDNDAVDPTAIWGTPDLAENTAITIVPAVNDPPSALQELRLRVNITVNTNPLVVSTQQFQLQFKAGTDGSCTTGSWTDVGAVGSSAWQFATSTVTDGADITAVLSTTTSGKGEEYSKANLTQANHVAATAGQVIEYDFHIIGSGSDFATATQYSFRVVESDDTIFDAYTNCPTLTSEPGTDNLMRHGNSFADQVEQGFFWAD